MVIKKRVQNTGTATGQDNEGNESIVHTPIEDQLDEARAAESYFPLDVAYQASCGSNLLFRLEVQEYEHPHAGQLKPNGNGANGVIHTNDESELK